MTQKIGIMYVCIQKRLIDRMKSNGFYCETYPTKEFFIMLGELFRVPKELRNDVLKEMQDMNLVKVDRNEIKPLKKEI